MKFWTLLLALLLALSLTACGGKRNDGGAANANDDHDVAGKGTNSAITGSNDANGGTVPGDIDGDGDSLFDPNHSDGTGNAANSGNGSAANNGADGNTASRQAGSNPVPQSQGGWRPATFDQMVRNGLVHDRDGILTDFENSVTPGSSHF